MKLDIFSALEQCSNGVFFQGTLWKQILPFFPKGILKGLPLML